MLAHMKLIWYFDHKITGIKLHIGGLSELKSPGLKKSAYLLADRLLIFS
jgi:hypothetical protein